MLPFILNMFALQIENLQEQLRDKEKQMSSLKERVKSLQADTSNTDTALTTLEESLAEKVSLFIGSGTCFLVGYICEGNTWFLPSPRSALSSV